MRSALFILRIIHMNWNSFKAWRYVEKPRSRAGVENPEVRRLAGLEGGLGSKLGIDDAFVLRAAKTNGDYSEMFERNLGTGSKPRIPRGLNQLWSAGGAMYAPPMR